MIKVFIDGSEGTTGIKIFDMLGGRRDIELIKIAEEKRKNIDERLKCLSESDITILCLPDDAAREIVELAPCGVRIIDASTAHRTNPDWDYGFPELSLEIRNNIAQSLRVAVPGCHASGFIALIYPLIKMGILDKNSLLSCFSLTGYSGGGKKMIAEYENETRSETLKTPRQYGLTQQHKHLKEMKAVTGLDNFPLFSPIVCDFYSGMLVTVPLFSKAAGGLSAKTIYENLSEYYKGQKMVTMMPFEGEGVLEKSGFLPAAFMSGRNDMKIFVDGNDERIILAAAYDNLGKGASGAAVQCLNIMTGQDETFGLI